MTSNERTIVTRNARFNPHDDLDSRYVPSDAASYDARLAALPMSLLRRVAIGDLTLEEAEAQA